MQKIKGEKLLKCEDLVHVYLSYMYMCTCSTEVSNVLNINIISTSWYYYMCTHIYTAVYDSYVHTCTHVYCTLYVFTTVLVHVIQVNYW